ncbi:heme A synthase [Photobacterium gaetbulicola]|uniref:Cytochrome c oxidase assembly protein n=1 Tax=Photobacterium gaetbulicola Gung47 TaxID=658445 RepID=A0A0C5WQ56_9GAMM|nr:COX15/CtaA family protein [Photobacterium gaetbulicola]AJR07174.1 cytochrome c oxidase assembly protein [Photobacterium gaetbulicola Gung47]PSU13785.1 heme A synthase [Photobacterium gaetbulicola]
MKQDNYRTWVAVTFALSLCVIALGAYTRLTEAGLGCPDWPGCYGFAGVPKGEAQQALAASRFPDAPLEADKAWNEMLHRYVAGTLGLMILALNIFAWRKPARPRALPALLLATVIFQALLGMWTVTMDLMPVVVMGHLLGGFTTASLLFLLWLRLGTISFPPAPVAASSGLRAFALFGLLVVIGQIALGGWTAANYAAVVCTQLPLCEVDWRQGFDTSAFALIQPEHETYQYGVLDYQQRVTIHVTHRIGAMVTALTLLALACLLWRQRALRRGAAVMLLVLAGQIGLGITNIVASLPLSIAVAHNVTGVLLLLSLVALNLQVYRMRLSGCNRQPGREMDRYVA